MKVCVLLFGFKYEGYVTEDVRVFSSKELAEVEVEKRMKEGDYDYYSVEEVEVLNK